MNPPDKNNGKVILGIDPGTNLLGYGLLRISGKSISPVAMGVIRLGKIENHYHRLRRIYDRVLTLVEGYNPQEMAIEAPFYGKNVQSMLKLGRAQGVAMAAALARNMEIYEYEPRKIKQVVTGNGAASKDQVREILRRVLKLRQETLDGLELDATDAMAAAVCHFYVTSNPMGIALSTVSSVKKQSSSSASSSWKNFIAANPSRIKKL